MARIRGRVVVDVERCIGCGACVAVCPCGVLDLSAEMNGNGYCFAEMVKDDACTGCALCGRECIDRCIVVYRQTEQ
jgi:2-oxoglutarate ferredoxin oxidoreductase subunit delta